MLTNSIISTSSRFSIGSELNSSTFFTSFRSIGPKFGSRKLCCGDSLLKVENFRVLEVRKGGEGRDCCFRLKRRCKGEDREVGLGLEEEILEFMRNSEKPEAFPLKKDLIDAGRMDLVHAISRQGGWLSLGWDLGECNDDEDVKDEGLNNGGVAGQGFDLGQESNSSYGDMELDSSSGASSSGRSLDPEVDDDTGIEGILSRLEKQRNMVFGIELREKTCNTTDDKGLDLEHKPSVDATGAGHYRSRRDLSLSPEGELEDTGYKPRLNGSFADSDGMNTPFQPDTWKSWMKQRAGSLDADFEAAEITFTKKKEVGLTYDQYDELLDIRDGTSESLDRPKEPTTCNEKISSNHIQVRIQHLERELASALHSLRSSSNGVIHQKAPESSDEDMRNLSDDWEFRENEIMRAQDRLRSTRAKLAVLEGKMALALVEAQKKMEENQKKIDHARRALSLLRTACIVWPNSASEVLLTGSFDGWSSQRKMERSNTGIFSTYLKLYPGRYEIKFIVDGVWKIDPLRPIANNNGYENNVLIVM